MSADRTRVLLSIVVVLALIRFAGLPWVTAQNEAHERLQVLTDRLDRSIGVLRNETAIRASLEKTRNEVGALRERFPAAADADAFRLDVQRRFGDIAAANGVQLRSFDWQADGSIDSAGLAYGRVRVSVEGELRSLIRVHGDLEGKMPNIAIREVTVSMSLPASASAESAATASFAIDVYFRSART